MGCAIAPIPPWDSAGCTPLSSLSRHGVNASSELYHVACAGRSGAVHTPLLALASSVALYQDHITTAGVALATEFPRRCLLFVTFHRESELSPVIPHLKVRPTPPPPSGSVWCRRCCYRWVLVGDAIVIVVSDGVQLGLLLWTCEHFGESVGQLGVRSMYPRLQ